MKASYLLLLFLLTPVHKAATTDVTKKLCLTIEQKIKTQNSKLRSGYSLKKGEQLKQKLRQLKKQKYACRMKRYPTVLRR